MRRVLLLVLLLALSHAATHRFGIFTDLHIGRTTLGPYHGEEDEITKKIRTAIAYVNAQHKIHPVSAVFVLGDISDKAQQSQYDKGLELLNLLSPPWLPLLGNHDQRVIMREPEEHEAPHHFTGDKKFKDTYAKVFSAFPSTEGKLFGYTGGVSVHNVEDDCESYLQNWAYHHTASGVLFLAFDWNSRTASLLRTKDYAETHNYPGGTLPWLNSTLRALETSSNRISQVVVLQHQPFRCPMVIQTIACWFDEGMELFQSVVNSHIPPARPSSHLPPLANAGWWGAFAGHIHRAFNGTAFEGKLAKNGWENFQQWETAAMKDQPHVTMITVANGKIANVERIDL